MMDARAHDHDHTHAAHAHAHSHSLPLDASTTTMRLFAIGVAINLLFVFVEAGFGWWADSLALLADAGHNFGDVIGLALAWGAAALATRRPSQRFTYGLGGSTILAALFNAMLLLIAVGGIVYAAIERFQTPARIDDNIVIAVAAVGIVVNAATALLFLSRRKEDLNARGAYLHMLADAAVSAGVVIAGLVIHYTGLAWIDPAMGIVIALVILASTWGLFRDSMRLALAAVPADVDADAVRVYLCGLDGVSAVHDLHIWAMSTSENALTAHLVMPDGHPGDAFLADVSHTIEHRHRVGHVTLQIETADSAMPCKQEQHHAV